MMTLSSLRYFRNAI